MRFSCSAWKPAQPRSVECADVNLRRPLTMSSLTLAPIVCCLDAEIWPDVCWQIGLCVDQCESCSVDQSNGTCTFCVETLRKCLRGMQGTCYCSNKNFGNLYCQMSPRWYHSNGRGVSYKGDRHPEPKDEFPLEAFEAEPRKCGNCGEIALMLKKDYL